LSDLTIKQQKFVDEYIILGNATEAYKKAGYAWKSENTAGVNGHKLLKNHKIAEAIAKRSSEVENERLMDIEEALMIEASIARGEPQEAYSKHYDHIKKEVIKEITYTLSPNIEERQRSLDHILKVNGAYLDRKEIDVTGAVQFVDDIGSGLDDG